MVAGHPKPRGGYEIGSIRARTPPGPDFDAGLFVQVTYPADLKAGKFDVAPFPYFRDECLEGMSKMQGGGAPLGVLRMLMGGRSQLDPSYLPLKAPNGRKWPIVIFSHGLYGAVEMYTQACRELASLGTIVVAMDHEDGTALHAIHGKTGERLYFIDEPGGGVLGGDDLETFSKKEIEFRHPFLDERVKELVNLTKSLIALAKGQAPASEVKEDKALREVMKFADPESFLLCSHSFGSTSNIYFFHSDKSKGLPFKGSIVADIWWQPDATHMTTEVSVPFVQMLSQEWCFNSDVRKGAAGALALQEASPLNSIGLVWFKGTRHLWFSEVSYLCPEWLLRKIGQVGTSDLGQVHEATTRCLRGAVEALLPGPDAQGTAKQRFEEIMYSHQVDITAKTMCGGSATRTVEIALPYNRGKKFSMK